MIFFGMYPVCQQNNLDEHFLISSWQVCANISYPITHFWVMVPPEILSNSLQWSAAGIPPEQVKI